MRPQLPKLRLWCFGKRSKCANIDGCPPRRTLEVFHGVAYEKPSLSGRGRNSDGQFGLLLRMTNPAEGINPVDPAIRSGAAHVEESEHLAARLTVPEDPSTENRALEDRVDEQMLKTGLANLTLSMFTQGAATRVRVGNPHNSSELYEHAFESADEANTAMLSAGILRSDQVKSMEEPAGTGLVLSGITVEQLEEAGLKRHGSSTL